MKFLLPYRFKKIGTYMPPIGLVLWLCMQLGGVTRILSLILGEDYYGTVGLPSLYHWANISVAVMSFFAFLVGLYFIGFSKEKVEDEMIKEVRLESFQFAALLQIVFVIMGLSIIGFMKSPPKDGGLMLFFIASLSIFWLAYIFRFNYIIHIAIFRGEK